jgi:hypothetical protein
MRLCKMDILRQKIPRGQWKDNLLLALVSFRGVASGKFEPARLLRVSGQELRSLGCCESAIWCSVETPQGPFSDRCRAH